MAEFTRERTWQGVTSTERDSGGVTHIVQVRSDGHRIRPFQCDPCCTCRVLWVQDETVEVGNPAASLLSLFPNTSSALQSSKGEGRCLTL